MFDVCHEPTPGTGMTFAYFHLKPYVFVSGDGAVTAGIEVRDFIKFIFHFRLLFW